MRSARILRVGRYDLDTTRRLLRGPRGEAEISPQASRLLQVLALQPGITIDRGYLIDQVWRGDKNVGDAALRRLACEIQNATGDSWSLVRREARGYRLATAAETDEPVGRCSLTLRALLPAACVVLACLLAAALMRYGSR